MKFYIASRLENAERVKQLKRELEAMGHEHSYDWTVHGSVQNEGYETISRVAKAEAHGVLEADLVIVLLPGGRGTHTELGIALGDALCRAPKLIGILSESGEIDFGNDGRTCAFYHHPLVAKLRSWETLLEWVRGLS
jgi:hypothetical protein